jgi:hypothetical protein
MTRSCQFTPLPGIVAQCAIQSAAKAANGNRPERRGARGSAGAGGMRGSGAADVPQTLVFRGDQIETVDNSKKALNDELAEMDEAAAEREAELVSGQQRCIVSLRKALAANGAYPNGDRKQPKSVSVKIWKDWAIMGGVKENSFFAYKSKLVAAGIVCEENGFARTKR